MAFHELEHLLQRVIADGGVIEMAYGGGRTPGSARTLQPLRIEYRCLIAVQLEPERRTEEQHYNFSSFLWVFYSNTKLNFPDAQARLIKRSEPRVRELRTSQRLNTAAIDTRMQVDVQNRGNNLFGWQFSPDRAALVIKAQDASTATGFFTSLNDVLVSVVSG